jgi:predicted TIM-barrel fold metal-dependent hydrolase
MPRHIVVDVDGHITEPFDMWERYLDPKFHDVAPRLVRTDDGVDAVAFGGGIHVPADNGIGMPGAGLAGRGVGPRTMYERRYVDGHPGGFEPRARLKAMDEDGIDIAVLFPTFSALMIATNPSKEFAVALARAYNDWIADFCRAAPGRLHAAAQVPLLYVDCAIGEARRAVLELGLKLVYLRPNPYGGRPWTDPTYDPFWGCVQELGVPIAFHEGTYPKVVPTAGADRFENFFQHIISHPFEQQLACLSFVAGGILNRFPRLKVLFLQAGCGWLPYWLRRIDHHYGQLGWMVPEITMKPSEYFRRQCYISFDPDEEDLGHVVNEIGAEKLLFASDFPHFDAIFPGAVAAVRDRSDLGEEAKRLILGGNALRLLGLEVAAA